MEDIPDTSKEFKQLNPVLVVDSDGVMWVPRSLARQSLALATKQMQASRERTAPQVVEVVREKKEPFPWVLCFFACVVVWAVIYAAFFKT